MFGWKKIALFVGGLAFGTAGVSVLSSKDAKCAYTHATAAVLRAKDSVMKTATTIKENCDDIYEDAKDINEKRYVMEEQLELEKARAIVAMHEAKEEQVCEE